MKWITCAILGMFLGIGCTGLAHGLSYSPGLISDTDAVVYPNSDNEDWSLGWEFSVSAPITVDALGYNYFGTPLNSSHEVGIYDASGDLLGSVDVTNASTDFDGYLYTSLGSPLVLGPGDYWITGTTLGLDGWIYNADDIVTATDVTYLDS
jgi:hypothetical protein